MQWSDGVLVRGFISRFAVVIGGALIVLVGATSAAHAEDADALIHKGIELRKQGKDQDALEVFRRAQALAPTPRAAAQLGFAEQALGRWVDAYEHVDDALHAANDPWIAKNRPVLESSLATIRKHVGEVEILGEPGGAEVRVDGRPQGTLPLNRRIRAAAGTISVEVRAAGFLPVTRAVVVTPEELVRETIILQPVTSLPPAAATGETARTAGDVELGRAPTSAEASRPWARPLAWAGVVGAGVFVAAGGIALGIRESKAQWFSDSAHACDENTPSRGAAGCKDAYDTGHTAGNLAIVSFAAAGAVAIGAAVLFYASGPHGDAGHPTAVSFACGPTGAAAGFGMVCATRF